MKRILFAIVVITFAACNSRSSMAATQDSTTEVMKSQRSAVKDSVTIKSDSNERTIDSSFKVLKDSMQKVK